MYTLINPSKERDIAKPYKYNFTKAEIILSLTKVNCWHVLNGYIQYVWLCIFVCKTLYKFKLNKYIFDWLKIILGRIHKFFSIFSIATSSNYAKSDLHNQSWLISDVSYRLLNYYKIINNIPWNTQHHW